MEHCTDAFPSFSVPSVVDCGCWLVGGRKVCEFKVRNDGGEGRFAIVPAASWPAVNFKVTISKILYR